MSPLGGVPSCPGSYSFADLVHAQLKGIAYGWTKDCTLQQCITAGFLVSEVFDGLNYRMVPMDYSVFALTNR